MQVIEVEANAVVRSRVVRDAETGVTPLPLAGIEGRFDFNERWSAEARVQYLSVEFDEIDGSVLDARAALTWRKNPHLVFGLGYRNFAVEVDSRDHRHAGPGRSADGWPAVVPAGQPVTMPLVISVLGPQRARSAGWITRGVSASSAVAIIDMRRGQWPACHR